MAIVKALTGEYDDAKTYTAWQLGADWWWNELDYSARIVGGRRLYDMIQIGPHEGVSLHCLSTKNGPRDTCRFVSPDTMMELVKDQQPAAG